MFFFILEGLWLSFFFLTPKTIDIQALRFQNKQKKVGSEVDLYTTFRKNDQEWGWWSCVCGVAFMGVGSSTDMHYITSGTSLSNVI